jgi:hypothetical protein
MQRGCACHPDLDLTGEILALCAQGAQLLLQTGHDDFGVGHNRMLLAERPADVPCKPLSHAVTKFMPGPADLVRAVVGRLRDLRKTPAVVRSFFQHLETLYAARA